MFQLNCRPSHFSYWLILWVLTHMPNLFRTLKNMTLLPNLGATCCHARLITVQDSTAEGCQQMGTSMHRRYKCELVEPSMEQSGKSYNTPQKCAYLLFNNSTSQSWSKGNNQKSMHRCEQKAFSIVYIEKPENIHRSTAGKWLKNDTRTTWYRIFGSLTWQHKKGGLLALVMTFRVIWTHPPTENK